MEQVSFWIVCGVQVPSELKEDLILIADKIEPYLLQVKEQADKIPEKAHELAGKIQPAAEKLGDQIEQGASKVLSNARAVELQAAVHRRLRSRLVQGRVYFQYFGICMTWLCNGHVVNEALCVLPLQASVSPAACMQDNSFRGHLYCI